MFIEASQRNNTKLIYGRKRKVSLLPKLRVRDERDFCINISLLRGFRTNSQIKLLIRGIVEGKG